MMPTSQKLDRWSIGFIGVISILVLVGGALQLHAQLFFVDNHVFEQIGKQLTEKLQTDQEAALLSDSTNTDDMTALQQKDSDKDGLNDFQEQYVYATNSYLADSDSDGISDSDEITRGTNPNCPEGETCLQARTDVNVNGGVSGENSAAAKAFKEFNPDQYLKTDANGNIDTTALRDELKKYGVSDDVLSKTDDATLLKMLQETAASTNTNASAASSATNSSGNAETANNTTAIVDQAVNQLENMTTDQKKDFLLQSGVSQDDLAKLSDKDLNTLFDEALKQAKADTLGTAESTSSDINSNNQTGQ